MDVKHYSDIVKGYYNGIKVNASRYCDMKVNIKKKTEKRDDNDNSKEKVK